MRENRFPGVQDRILGFRELGGSRVSLGFRV